MKIAIEDHWHSIVYTLAGEIDDQWGDKFQKRARFELAQKELSRSGGFDLILDLAGVTAISSTAVKILAKLRRDLESRGVQLALCKLEPELEKLLIEKKNFSPAQIFPSIFAAELGLGGVINE